jgi:cytochrome c peroxidase
MARQAKTALADIPLTVHYRGLLWDKRKNNLEEMIELPIKDEVEMGMQFSDLVTRLQGLDYYDQLFQNAYGSNEINQARITHALADFVRTLLPDNTKLDQGIASNFANFSNQEINGLLLFQRDCWHCHTNVPMANEDLSELSFPNINAMVSHPYNNGLSLTHATDQGFGEVSGLSSDIGRFNSPSLKNIALSAPYMHDGSLATLEDVVDFYSEEIKPDPNSFFSVANYYGTLSSAFTGFNYSDDEKASLVAFMRTLTDSSFINNPIYSNPFTETIVNSVSQIDPNLVEGVSPNPMTNSAIVRFENPAGKVTNIRLSNTEGRVVLVGASADNSYTIDRQNLPAGLYIVSVEQGNKRAMSKLLIE